MNIVIQKFGGTSVEDAAAMARSIDIVRERGITRRTRPLVVLSACASVTNMLVKIGELALVGQHAEALSAIDHLEVRHARIARELLREPDVVRVQRLLHALWEELRTLGRGVELLHELTPKSRDQIQSLGERASSTIFHAALEERLSERSIKIPCLFLDAREFFITSSEFTVARPLVKEITRGMKKIRSVLLKGGVGVTQGFIGRTASGDVTTIGRGGSDFSAAIMGVSLGASEIQIWTDVAGILTCDPRIVSAAKTIERISIREASELTLFGAKVLHPETIWPAVEQAIPVRVLSSREPEKPGTVIVERVTESRGMTGIAVKKSISLLHVSSKGSHPNAELQQAVWNALAAKESLPLAVAFSADAASYAFSDAGPASEGPVQTIRAACEGRATLTVDSKRSLITIVGPALAARPGIALRIFRALGNINCEMVSFGGSQSAISIVVQDDVANRAIKKLHAEFFE